MSIPLKRRRRGPENQRKRRRQWENEIPMDLVEEILTKLPAKSLVRFMSVSKLWSSYICSPYFTNHCLTIQSRQSHRVYMCLQDTIDYRNTETLSLVSDTTSSSFCFVVNHDLTIPRIGCVIVQNLSNFFMCYTFNTKPRIFNPTTRQLVTLPIPAALKTNKIIPGEHNKGISYYFGYDPGIDQYKVVCSTSVFSKNSEHIESEHWVFVLKDRGGRFWKKLDPNPEDFLPHIPASGGICIDGVIYYLGWTSYWYDPAVLIIFHIRSEDFKMIRIPPMDGDHPELHLCFYERIKNLSLIECSGKVTIIDQYNLRENGVLDLWSLEDFEKKKWCRKTPVLQHSQRCLVKNIAVFNVRGTTQDGKVYLIPKDLFYPFHIISYDLRSNDMKKIEIKGVPDHWFKKDKSTINLTLMDLNESFMYLET